MQKPRVHVKSKSKVGYHLCPHCFRATPAQARERYCPNDGTLLIDACPNCGAKISSPHNRYCNQCGYALSLQERR